MKKPRVVRVADNRAGEIKPQAAFPTYTAPVVVHKTDGGERELVPMSGRIPAAADWQGTATRDGRARRQVADLEILEAVVRSAAPARQLLTLDDLPANFSTRICRGVDINVPLASRQFGGLIVGECDRPFKGALGFRDCNGHIAILAR